MLPFTRQSTKMHPLRLLLWAFMAMTAAQPRCDSLTQYEKDGECCNMCGPGTSMTSLGSCLEPQCKDCDNVEYQDKYTSAPKCERQRFCDPNLNFEVPVHETTKQTICRCKPGFHCSSIDCSDCRQHSACKPGQWAQSKGDHMHDTVCQKCSEGTFSNETSRDSVCKKWTECGDGHRIARSGTDTSDNICEETPRMHMAIFLIIPMILILILVLGFCLCKAKRGDAHGKDCFESHLGDKMEPVKLLTVTPTEPLYEESMVNEVPSSQEEGLRSPEESDEPSLEMSTDIPNGQPQCVTENGKCVAQENGTTEKLSRQESQTQTFPD